MNRPLRNAIEFCQRHAWQVVLSQLLLTLAAGYAASHLDIRADLSHMLPSDAPSVQALEQLDDSYGGQLGRMTVALEGDDPETLRTLADTLGPGLESLEGVSRVEVRRPSGFFEDHRLLYIQLHDLERVQERLQSRIRWEKAQANPLFVQLEDSAPPPVDIQDIESQYDGIQGSDYYESASGEMLAIFIYPSFPAGELDRSKALGDDVRALVEDATDDKPGVTLGLSGRYQKRVELQSTLMEDLGLATSVALLAIVVFLLLFIRSPWGTGIVLLPLIAGTVWSLAWAWVVFGSLNLLTGFLGAILLGLGVDYGIHLYARFVELSQSEDTGDALAETFQSAGRANLFAGLTTLTAFGSLIISDFQAFYEFGVIAVGGIALILTAYAILFPALVVLVNRLSVDLPAPRSATLSARISTWLEDDAQSRGSQRARRTGAAALVMLGLTLGVSLVGIPQLDFDRSFKQVEATDSAAWEIDERVNDMLGRSQTPAVVLTDNAEHSRLVVADLRYRKAQREAGYTIDRVLSIEELLPQQQSRKLAILRDLQVEIEGLPESTTTKRLRSLEDEISVTLDGGAIQSSDLPEAVREPFSRKDAPSKSVVLVFPSIDLADVEAIGDFVNVLHDLPGVDSGHEYDAISDALLLHDIIRFVERDAAWMLGITISGLVLLSAAAFRRASDVAIQLATIGLATAAALGTLGLVGVELNFLNVVVLPIWLGLGVDATFHILLHLRDRSSALQTHVSIALTVAAAYLTTMLGFGAMLLASHRGLFSLGEVAVMGLATILIVAVSAQWALIRLRGSTSPESDRGDPEKSPDGGDMDPLSDTTAEER